MPLYFLQPGGSDRGSNCDFASILGCRDRVRRHTSKNVSARDGDQLLHCKRDCERCDDVKRQTKG